jgi:hypothetical protein
MDIGVGLYIIDINRFTPSLQRLEKEVMRRASPSSLVETRGRLLTTDERGASLIFK